VIQLSGGERDWNPTLPTLDISQVRVGCRFMIQRPRKAGVRDVSGAPNTLSYKRIGAASLQKKWFERVRITLCPLDVANPLNAMPPMRPLYSAGLRCRAARDRH